MKEDQNVKRSEVFSSKGIRIDLTQCAALWEKPNDFNSQVSVSKTKFISLKIFSFLQCVFMRIIFANKPFHLIEDLRRRILEI